MKQTGQFMEYSFRQVQDLLTKIEQAEHGDEFFAWMPSEHFDREVTMFRSTPVLKKTLQTFAADGRYDLTRTTKKRNRSATEELIDLRLVKYDQSDEEVGALIGVELTYTLELLLDDKRRLLGSYKG